jgi:hypothetical protein
VLSVNLFLLAMMDITSGPRDPVTMTGYADDWTIFARHSYFDFIQNELQCTVNNMNRQMTMVFDFQPPRPFAYTFADFTLEKRTRLQE